MLSMPIIPEVAGWYWAHLRDPSGHVCAQRCDGWAVTWIDPATNIELNPMCGPSQTISEREYCILCYDKIGPKLDPPTGNS